jgi:DNA invertase Pin-like site-specific DNA recombinase
MSSGGDMRVGYVRVSTADQNDARQVHELDVEKLFIDRASGKSTSERPQLAALLEFVREGDLVIVHSMDRLARNLDDLRALVRSMNAKGVQVQFLTEHLTFTGDDSPMSNLLLSVMGAFAEFERALIRERQREASHKPRRRASTKVEAARCRPRRPPNSGRRSPPASRKQRSLRPLGNSEISPNVRFSCLLAMPVPQTAIGRP